MAYKDEYEVARLFTNGEFMRQLREQFEGDFTLQFHMAPPLLSRVDPNTGEPRKRSLPGWCLPAFKLLAAAKGLRGSRWDIFSYTAERRMERELCEQFLADLADIAAQLTFENRDYALELVSSLDKVRGFGHVKQANAQRYAAARRSLLAKFNGDALPFVELASATNQT